MPSTAPLSLKKPVSWQAPQYGMSFLREVITRVWDVVRNPRAPFNSDEFVQTYGQTFSDSLDLLQGLPHLSDDDLEAGTTAVLQAIVLMTTAYHRKRGVQINANYMLPEAPSDDLRKRCSFVPKIDSREPDAFLVLVDWAVAVDGLPSDFVLPVHRSRPLFGAPAAYVRNRPYVVQDTLALDEHLEGQPDEVREEFRRYFSRHARRLRSFVSLPLVSPAALDRAAPPAAAAAMGVLNVQSNRTAILGLFSGNRRKLEVALLPLTHVMSYCLAELTARRSHPLSPNRRRADLEASWR